MEMQVNPQFTGRRAGKTGSQRKAKTSAAVSVLKATVIMLTLWVSKHRHMASRGAQSADSS